MIARILLAGVIVFLGVVPFSECKAQGRASQSGEYFHRAFVPAGAIRDERDAQRECPAVAARFGGTWTGQWATLQPSGMSIAEVEWRFSENRKAPFGQRGTLRIEVSGTPQTVAPGEKATLKVIVRSADGRPLAGANVRVSAGGGKFLSSADENFDLLADRICHCHFKDFKPNADVPAGYSSCDLGAGTIPNAAVAARLTERGYDKWVALETYGRKEMDPVSAVRKELPVLKEWFGE